MIKLCLIQVESCHNIILYHERKTLYKTTRRHSKSYAIVKMIKTCLSTKIKK